MQMSIYTKSHLYLVEFDKILNLPSLWRWTSSNLTWQCYIEYLRFTEDKPKIETNIL